MEKIIKIINFGLKLFTLLIIVRKKIIAKTKGIDVGLVNSIKIINKKIKKKLNFSNDGFFERGARCTGSRATATAAEKVHVEK